MKNLIVFAGAALSLALLGGGCSAQSSMNARIQEKSGIYNALTPVQQKTINEGSVEVGNTADMVYLALGQPMKVREKSGTGGKVEMWTYMIFRPQDVNTYSTPTYGTQSASYRYPPELWGSNMAKVEDNYNNGNVQHSSGATAGQVTTCLTLPEMKSELVHLFLFNGRVVRIVVDT